MLTPWGKADLKQRIQKGVYWVSTPSHGGLMVGKAWAREHLSKEAQERGDDFGQWLCYEEDCQCLIVFFEYPMFMQGLFVGDFAEALQNTTRSLSRFDPEFLISKGVTPCEPQYTQYKQAQIENQLRKDKSPDLIVSARGDWHTGIKGVCEVITADNKNHYVLNYDGTKYPLLLSNFTLYKGKVKA